MDDRVACSTMRLRCFSTVLLVTSSLTGLLATGPAAYGQTPEVETVVVTGTSIRGQAPVGSNLITVDRASIQATGATTTQELLASVPQLGIGFGSSGQAQEAAGGNASGPTIHSLGSQASNSTLVLIDGHRIPPVGIDISVVDPSIVPPAALQRVEVLPDGASSVYGADAVAGVVNFITRRNFTGWETSVQYGYAPSYDSSDFGQLMGQSWTGGSVLVAYNYSSKSRLMNKNRSFIGARQDIIRGADADPALFTGLPAAPPAGSMTTTPIAGSGTTGPFGAAIPYPSTGSNFQNFNCPTATIAANTTSPAFLYPYNGAGISTTQITPSQGVCDSIAVTSALPSQTRNSTLVSVRQAITPNVTASVDLIYGSVAGTSQVSRGTVAATVFGPTGSGGALGTAQRNPFYVGNATTGTSSEFIRYDFNQLLGPGATTHAGTTNLVGDVGLNWDMGSGWETELDADMGFSTSVQTSIGSVCGACALLALNGTANSNGTANTTPSSSALIDPNLLNTVFSVNRALTTANALDVWDPPGSTNKTSAGTLASLVDANSTTNAGIALQDYTLKADGPLFDLGTGPIKVAVGAEYAKARLDRTITGGSAIGGASSLSQVSIRDGIGRSSLSAFLEFNVPLISEANNIPLIQSFDVDISGRFDHFSDFGDTENPKVGFNWVPFDGVKLHGSYGTSFMAPELATLGDGGPQPVRAGTGGNGIVNGLVVPFNSTLNYSSDPVTFAGGGIAGTFMSTAAACAAAGSNPVNAAGSAVSGTDPTAVACKLNTSNSQGLALAGTDPNIGPQTGLSYSAGLDLDAGKLIGPLDGLVVQATYYNTKINGYIGAAGVVAAIPRVNAFAPPGGWPSNGAVIQSVVAGRPVQVTLPSVVYYVVNAATTNGFSIWQEGLDFSIHYRLNTDNLGTFNFGIDGNQIISFRQGFSSATALSIVDGNNNGRQTAIEMTEVTSVGWQLDSFTAQLQVQFAHPWQFANGNFPYNLAGPGRRAGYEHIGPLYNANLHLAYNLPNEWFAGAGMRVFMNVNNILNTPPPYGDTASGAPAGTTGTPPIGNAIGRLIEVGFSKEF